MKKLFDTCKDILIKIWLGSVVAFWLCLFLKIDLYAVFGYIVVSPFVIFLGYLLFYVVSVFLRLLISSKRIDKKSGQTSQSIKQLQEKDDVFDDLSISSPNYYTERQISALLGEIYEKYIGQLLENRGYSVEYNGINKGKEDGGVDLIARKGRIIALVQCKNWNQKQVIHEKYIHQLQGAVDVWRCSGNKYIGIFCCTCAVSDKARKDATKLGILLSEHCTMSREYWQKHNPFRK